MDDWAGWEQWYEVVAASTSTLRQGDILRNLFVVFFPDDLPDQDADPPDRTVAVRAKWDRGTWVVMSASCDVDKAGTGYDHVLMGRVLPATKEALRQQSEKEFEARLEVLRQGHPSAFLLPPHPTSAFQLSIVQWKAHLTMPTEYIRRAAVKADRLRLKSPLRESFGNWVGGNIQRVGIEDQTAMPKFRKIGAEQILRVNEDV